MKTSKLAIVVSFLLGGAAGAVAYSCLGPGAEMVTSERGTSLNLSDITRGELTQASPVNLNDGSRYQVFRVRPEQAGLLRIHQQGALNARLALLNDDHEIVQSSMEGELFSYFEESPEQSFTLVVSGADYSSFGPFRLQTEWLDVRNDGDLPMDESIQGYLSGAPNQYRLLVEEAGMYQVDMSTSLFDSYLRIDGNGVYEMDDDSGAGLDARLSVMLQPGEYTVTATTPYSDASDTFGTFSIEASKLSRMDDYQQGGQIEVGQQIQGFLQGGSLTYELVLEEDAQVRIALDSHAFDTVLEVQGNDVSLHDDDGGSGTNSLLNQRLAAGTYSVLVRAFSSGHGEFSLQVQ